MKRYEYVVNWYMLICGCIYAVIETAHFGWNTLPGSSDEVIADGIGALIICLSVRKERVQP